VKVLWIPVILAAFLAALFLLFRPRSPEPEKPSKKIVLSQEAPSPLAPPIFPDPLIRRWHAAVKQRNQRQILDAQTGFRSREEEYRPSLVKLAQEDPDPRVRAFTISLLGGFKVPPPERFFIERLEDGQEYPRESALAALDRLGTASCLEAVDRLASSDPVERVRTAAAQTRKAVRAR